MRLRECSLLALLLLTVNSSAKSASWYPIDTGRYWTYSSPGGGSSTAMIDASELFAGATVQPMAWNSGVREHFSQDGAGRVFHHGSVYPDGSYSVFNPPFLFLDSDLSPGHSWTTAYEVIQYNSSGVETNRLPASFACVVLGVGPVTVPAGTFAATEVLITSNYGALPQATFRNDYAEGVGWIRRTNEAATSVFFELQAYGGGALRTEAVTWGAVKAMYRN